MWRAHGHLHGHVYRHVYSVRHLHGNVYGQVCGHMYGHVYGRRTMRFSVVSICIAGKDDTKIENGNAAHMSAHMSTHVSARQRGKEAAIRCPAARRNRPSVHGVVSVEAPRGPHQGMRTGHVCRHA